MNIKRALLMSGACGILATAVSTALAQQSSEVAEVVIVTGSYIRGTAEDAALPVDVISAEDLAKQGSPSTLEMIKGLSVSNGVLGDTNQFDARAQGSEGSGSVNLRGFGPQRTLVLLNGRRMVASPFLIGAVDTNFIPLAAIGRVEVLKDGAAATYGSDAIGGVVNFITKENLRGVDVAADFKQIEDSDGDYSASGAFGWGNDRMHGLFAVGYQHRSELLVKDRDWAHRDYLTNPQGGWSAAGNPSSYIPTGVNTPSTANPLGLPVPAIPIRDPQCDDLGGFPGRVASGASVCYWQYSVYDALDRRGRSLPGLHGLQLRHHRFDRLPLRSDVCRYRDPGLSNLAVVRGAADADLAGPAVNSCVRANNPGWAPFMAANPGVLPANGDRRTAGGQPALRARRQSAVRLRLLRRSAQLRWLPRVGGIERRHLRFAVVGLRRNVHGAEREARRSRYGRQPLPAGAARPRRTELQHRGQHARRERLLLLQPIQQRDSGQSHHRPGQQSVRAGRRQRESRAAELDVPGRLDRSADAPSLVIDAVLSGSTGINLPGGSLAWAAGAQYRDSSFEATYSDLNNFAVTPCVASVGTGIIGPSACTPAQLAAPTGALLFLGGADNRSLDQDVSAVFAELSLPITDSFQAQLAARYEDYGGDIGSTFDPKLSLRWQLFDAFALRGSVGTTFRGPALQQTDASSVTTLQSVAGTFRAIRTFGDPGLKPESALTFNVGMLVKAGGFNASLDYWSFDFEDQIVNEPVAGHHELRVRRHGQLRRRPGKSAGRRASPSATATATASSTTLTARPPTSSAWTSTSSTGRT